MLGAGATGQVLALALTDNKGQVNVRTHFAIDEFGPPIKSHRHCKL